MKPLPLFFNLENKKILIAGGGRIALRKARKFKQAGALITVIAPQILEKLQNLADNAFLRPACEQDISTDFQMMLIATDNRDLNNKLAKSCKKNNIFFNRCDDYTESDFFSCTDLNFDSISISIFSGGVPETSKFLRKKIESMIGKELIALNNILSSLRPAIKEKYPLEEQRKSFYANFLNEKFLKHAKDIGPERLKKELESWL